MRAIAAEARSIPLSTDAIPWNTPEREGGEPASSLSGSRPQMGEFMTFKPPCRGIVAAVAAVAFAIVAGLAPSPGRTQPAPENNCFNFANQMIADNFRGQQAKCPDYRSANMKWESHLQWCEQQPRDRVESLKETSSAKLDGCLTSAQGAAVPPVAPVPAPPAGPAKGKSFHLVPAGAEDDVPLLCVDVAGGALAQGTPVQLWKCHGKAPQLFGVDGRNGRIYLAAAPHLCVDGIPNQQLLVVQCQSVETQWRYEERTKTIRSSNGMCWDVSGGRRPENIRSRRPLIAWPCHNGPNQQFIYND